jgi:hypothetical protein
MVENDKERTLADMEKTFYDCMSKNTVFSALNRSASALESLSENTDVLAREIKRAGESSSRLARSLNVLTGVAVFIAAVALGLEFWKS